MGKPQRGFQVPPFVKPVQDAGCKGVARPIRAGDSRLRDSHGRHDQRVAIFGKGDRPMREMHKEKFHRSGCKNVSCIFKTALHIGLPAMSNRPSGKSGNLEIIDDEIVEMTKAWGDGIREAVCCLWQLSSRVIIRYACPLDVGAWWYYL